MSKAMLEKNKEHVERLKYRFVHELNSLQEITGLRIELNGNPLASDNYGIGIVNFCIPDIKMNSESLLLLLGTNMPNFEIPIYVSTTSACSSGSNSPSRVLMALPGMTREKAVRSIRVSFSADNTIAEIEYFIAKLKFLLENMN